MNGSLVVDVKAAGKRLGNWIMAQETTTRYGAFSDLGVILRERERLTTELRSVESDRARIADRLTILDLADRIRDEQRAGRGRHECEGLIEELIYAIGNPPKPKPKRVR